MGDAFGVTRGSYEYVDANGALQIVNYVADPVNGFRVAGTNIPVAPVAPQIPVHAPLIAPEPVMETPEVKAARAEHLAAHEKLENAVQVSERKKRSAATPAPIIVNSLPSPFINQAFAHPSPIAPLPLSAFPGPVGSAGPFPLPAGPSPFPFAQAPLPVAAASNPFPVANANTPFPVGASPLNFAAAPFVGAPLPIGHAALPLTSAPLSFAGAPLALSGAPLPFSGVPFSAAPAPFAPVPNFAPSSQFHAQDEFGQFSFGYENINSKKTETKDALGVTRGSYEYVDANGALQIVNYVADPYNGFRVAGTNIPVAPLAPQIPVHAPLIAPEPVMETPEVKAARAEHLAAHEKLENAVQVSERKKRSAATPAPIIVNSLPSPFINQAFAHPSPIAPLPLSAFPGPVGSAGPFPLPAGPSPFPFAQAPLPVAAAFNPFPVANANTPFPVGASPLNFAAAPFVGAPLPIGHAALPLTSAPLPFAGAPLPL